MENKTILIPDTNNDIESITNFEEQAADYGSYQAQTVSYVKNKTFKRHIPNDADDFNFIIASSSSVFKQLTHIQANYKLGTVHEVRETFIENINIFANNLSMYEIEDSEELVARYVLCTLVDELVNTTYFGRENDWSSNSLLNIFHNESYGGDNFFKLLDKFLKAPAKYIFMLEFMYVCLSLGFEGKYRLDNSKKYELMQLKDSLYKQIKIVKGRGSLKFYKQERASKTKHRLFYKMSYLVISLFTLIVLAIIYLGLSYNLEKQEVVFTTQIQDKYPSINYLVDEKNFILEEYIKVIND
jgi:type VI secretion system protein ImpK